MKRSFVAGLAISALLAGAPLSAASAADLWKAPPPAPVSTWTGCYIGGGIGYGMWNQNFHGETYPGLVAIENVDQTAGGGGWLGRAGLGCDYQFASSFVIGAFADYDWSNIHGNFQDPTTDTIGNEKLSHSWAAGGRVGYLPYPNLLTFVSVGFTQAHFDAVTLSLPIPPNTPELGFGANSYNGWFLGGGYEYTLPWWNSLSWKTEYRFSDFRAADLPVFNVPAGTSLGFAEHSDKSVQSVTTGLVWRFNFGGHWN